MKKLMALLLSMVMVLSLAACGGALPALLLLPSPIRPWKRPLLLLPLLLLPQLIPLKAPPTEGNATTAETVGDPFEAMAEDYISYPLEGDNTISMWYYIPRLSGLHGLQLQLQRSEKPLRRLPV